MQGTGKDLHDPGLEAFRAQYTIGQAEVNLSRTVPVRSHPYTVSVDIPPHSHDYFEVCLVRGGRAQHRTRQGRAVFEAGGVAVLAPGDIHAFEEVRGLEVTNVYYLTEWLLGELRSLWDQDGLVPLFLARSLFPSRLEVAPQWTLTPTERDLCEREIAAITEEERARVPSLVYLKSALLKFLVVLGRAYVRAQPQETGFGFRREVRLALDHIETAVREARMFSLAELGRHAGVSGGHAARLFKQATGQPAQEYFQRRRAQHAALRLLDPAKSITEIAYETGYADSAHFSRLFRKHLDLTPRQYRQQYSRTGRPPA